MDVHSISIFARKDLTPKFNSLDLDGGDVILRLHSGDSISNPPGVAIFFADQQEAVNFKNAIIQSWETFLKEEAKKKS